MSNTESKTKFNSLLLFIHRYLADFLAKAENSSLSKSDAVRLQDLSGTIRVLIDFASDEKEIYAILNNFEYAMNHLGLANFKTESALKEAEEKIYKLAK